MEDGAQLLHTCTDFVNKAQTREGKISEPLFKAMALYFLTEPVEHLWCRTVSSLLLVGATTNKAKEQ